MPPTPALPATGPYAPWTLHPTLTALGPSLQITADCWALLAAPDGSSRKEQYLPKGEREPETAYRKRLDAARPSGFSRIDIIAHALRDDMEASRVEAALIELVGLAHLTNAVRGRFSTDYPRRALADFVLEHSAERVEVVDPALVIRINREFEYGMSAQALYETTRGIWVIGDRRDCARLALAVFDGVVREVYEIESWHRAGSTPYETRVQAELAEQSHKRWEFLGHVATEPFRSRYLGGSVSHLFRKGQQSPIVGVGLE